MKRLRQVSPRSGISPTADGMACVCTCAVPTPAISRGERTSPDIHLSDALGDTEQLVYEGRKGLDSTGDHCLHCGRMWDFSGGSGGDLGCRSGAGWPSEPGGLQGVPRHLEECG